MRRALMISFGIAIGIFFLGLLAPELTNAILNTIVDIVMWVKQALGANQVQ